MVAIIVVLIIIIWILLPVVAHIFRKKDITLFELVKKLRNENQKIEDDDDY